MDDSGPRPPADPIDEDLADLYEHAPCGYLSTLPEGLIVRTNATLLRWLGRDREAVVGRTRFVDLLSPGGRIFHETHFSPLLRMQGFVNEIALDLVCADGTRLPVLVTGTARSGGDVRPALVRLTVFDARDRRRYERELLLARERAEQAAQARSDLVAMISHDVRGPLNAILTAAALLEKSDPTPPQQRLIRVLRSSADQATALVNSVLDLSRLEAGRSILHEREFDFRQLAADVMSGIQVAATPQPDLSVHCSIGDQIPGVLIGDPGKIGQILTNLLTNAVKFTERGRVSLVAGLASTTADRATLEIIVSDTGIGIPADQLPHILEEFTQGSEEIARRFGGSGLGLAIVRKLLRLYGSELHVASTVGQGSTFSFLLPLRKAGSLNPAPRD